MFNNKIDGMNQTPTLNFGLKDTKPVQCTDCKGEVFQNGVLFRKVSKILAGTDKDALVPITIPYCVNCMAPLDELLPPELKQPKFSLEQ
jgi:hypothetical protein